MQHFGWFPVTVDRPSRSLLHIVHAARYDDLNHEVAVDDDYQARYFGVGHVVAISDQEMRFVTEYDEPITIRQTVPADAARWDRLTAGIDLPIEIIGGIMTFTVTEPSVAAAVDDDGTVHTMILETAVGLYARYAASWIRMTDISPIESLDIVDVPPEDLTIYDDADQRGQTVNIAFLHPYEAPSVSATEVTPEQPSPSTASAAPGTILINSAEDLPDAIAFAASHPDARWYVARRAKAFGWQDPLPWDTEINDQPNGKVL